ncbi:MAG TPA: glycosyltransferase [Mycobacterium sp.]
MRVLLSAIGSRGDVQPMVALALHLREIGHAARLCAPPNFGDWIRGFGLPFVSLGDDLRLGPRYVPGGATTTVATHFETLRGAAADCDVIVGCAVMQTAAPSVAELLAIPYVYATYAPVTLPSTHHCPVPTYPGPDGADPDTQWDRDAKWWNDTWRDGLNAQRAAVGLALIDDVRRHVLTDRPLLAADPMLAPWPTPAELTVVQTGAWLLSDRQPLPPDVVAFLDAGDPPIYFGFGSMRVARALGPVLIAAARDIGYRAIIHRGWADLSAVDDSSDWLAIGQTNHQRLFARVAAVVHHGGSGTTTAAARAGVPQVVVPHHYDQYYFAERVVALGIGAGYEHAEPAADSLSNALKSVLSPTVAARARSVAASVHTDGTSVAAREILGRAAAS